MRFLLLSSLVFGGAFLYPQASRGSQQPSVRLVAEDNVNSRYTVESIEVAGEAQPVLTPSLRERVASLVGARFDPAEIEALAREIRKELRLRSVKPHVMRGTEPDRVRVQLITERRSVEFDVSVPKFLYQSNQGWSAQVQASTTFARDNVVRFGVLSDGDELTERFAGFNASYENLHTGSSRIHTAFLLEEFHEQWHDATVRADGAAEPDLYRSRRNLQPEVIFLLARPLTVTVGTSFESMQAENPANPRTEQANAFVFSAVFDKPIESADFNREVTASYSLRAAVKPMGGDYHYSRHLAAVRYAISFGRATLADAAMVGGISGVAPLFERFVLGTSSLLRGWNRYEIDPLGGNRVVHNSVDYSYRLGSASNGSGRRQSGSVQVFYDAGALWNQGQNSPVRQSVGVGYRQSVFSAALAFPVRGGRVDPVFMVGMNY